MKTNSFLTSIFSFGLLFTLILGVNGTYAQSSRIGLKGGVNFADITDDSDATDIRVGYHVGGFAKIQVTDFLAVQPEFLYSLQGSKISSNTLLGGTEEENLNLHYITLPVMVKLFPVEGFNIQAGPQFGYLIDAKYGDQNIDNVFSETDWSLNVGVGFDLEDVQLGARYNFGLNNIYTGDQDNTNENRVIQVYIGFAF